MSPSAPDRQALRQQLIAQREALSPQQRSLLTQSLITHLQQVLEELAPQSLAFYWPHRGEPDLRPLISCWLAADPARIAALPRVLAKHAPLGFVRWQPDTPMQPDAYGIPTPAADNAAVSPQVVIVPCNAFNAAGYRLGYGAGYYDRTLATMLPRPHTIGVAFELARYPALRAAAHDVPLDMIITEAGCLATASNRNTA